MPDAPNTDEPVEESQDAPGDEAAQPAHGPAAGQDDAEPEAHAPGRGAAGDTAAPQATLPVLINSIATQVFVSLGVVENPLTGTKQADLESAKFSIDLLSVLADKTQGNLTDMEKRYLEGVLYELRMRFVQAAEPGGQPDTDAQPESDAPPESAPATDGDDQDDG